MSDCAIAGESRLADATKGGASLSVEDRLLAAGASAPDGADRFLARTRTTHMQPGNAFTLIELLTVIAIIAVLASLLMTSLASANKKSRAAVCTFNLHQIGLALNLYLDEEGKHPSVDALATSKYLPTRKSLLCPEDKVGNWGRVVMQTSLGGNMLATNGVGASNSESSQANYSYLMHPFSWDEDRWKQLMRFANAGVAACQLHGLGNQNTPDIRNYAGLLLRGQRDGAVSRRKLFWPDDSTSISQAPSDSPGALVPTGTVGDVASNPASVLPIYVDDPGLWPQLSP